ncbi:TIGD6 [Cordylochernes scorpioides]|uniref:TIGD6 n=1 Tax=Cordylochernes scorpioides TaxID=51811 RepID=A0ABY6KH70_9ARAC|nr:TIGD6 [Cordylochernes scorpioides]
MSSQKRKRESITIEKKKEICQLARNNLTMSKNEIGKRFSLPRTTVRDILTQAEKWENYTRFKGRFHISQRRLCGEGASISPAIIDEHLTNLNSIMANCGYDPANIYNADETGLFFQLIPDRTLAHKDENCRGVKRMKQRITVLLCCNSTGTDKRRLLIIGKSAKPRCFRNFSPHFYCTYTSNSKAWMTSSIFQEWLLQFNKQLVSEGRRILLLLDNATSHCVPNDGLSNIKIHFLPPNMTASLQPLDSGIIKSFKAQYRKLQLQKMMELADAHLPTELCLDYAVRYCKMAWDSEAEMKLTDNNFLVSTVTAKEELGEDDDATVTQRLPTLREARTAAETILLFLEHSKRATSDDVNLSADLLRRVYAISEGEKTQVVITDFFKKMVVNGIGKKREAESNGQKFQVDRPRPVRTPATVSKVKRLATTENPPSQRQLSRMCGTSLKTINNIIHKDLELDTRRKGKVHKLTPFHMKNRATNARKLYEEHHAGSRSEYTATLDEAWMYVTYCNGIRKICYIKRGNQVPDNWVHQCSETFPKGFMVVGVMTGRGVLPLIKVPSKVKVNSEFYIECVLKPVIEQLKDLYPREMDKVFLHHDKASSHTSNKTQQFLQEMKDTLGLNFIRNSDIPVKSPDASPLDFYGFGMLKQRLFNRRPKTEAGLWKAAQEEWSNVSLSKVKEVFAAWKVRCREIAKKKGKHIEHMKKIHVRKIKF